MILFLDNYKGFHKTFIPFADVNFFVGENSTGKTAVLELLELLSISSFWIDFDFNSQKVGVKPFAELVNKFVNSAKSFTIGIEFIDVSEKLLQRLLLTFKDTEDGIALYQFKFTTDDKSVWCSSYKGDLTYKVREYNSLESFEEWINDVPKYIKRAHIMHGMPLNKIPIAILKNIIIDNLHGVISAHGKIRTTVPRDLRNCRWIAPIRAKARRIYESLSISYSPEGEHIPFLLNRLLGKSEKGRFVSRLCAFGKESGLFDYVDAPNYGKKGYSPFEIRVQYNGLPPINIINVGYGVPQVMPLLVEILTSKDESFAIQQPEVHLHPRAQAAFGSFIYDSAKNDKNTFYIETHSDFTINRYRYSLFKDENKRSDLNSQVLFFSRDDHGTYVTPIIIDNNGRYPEDIPEEFGKFFLDEAINMLEI